MANTTQMDNSDMNCSHGYTPFTSGLTGQPPMRLSNSGASYQDPAQIQAWAASATGGSADVQQTLDVHDVSTLPRDGSWTSVPPQPSGYLSHSNSSDGSDAWYALSSQQSQDPAFHDHFNGIGASQSGGIAGLAIAQSFGCELGPNIYEGHYAMDATFPPGRQPYPSPTENDMPFPSPNDGRSCALEEDSNVMDTCHGWSASLNTQETDLSFQENCFSNGWTARSVDPSVSSRSSHQPDTPLSLPQEHWDDTLFEMHPTTTGGPETLLPAAAPFLETQSTMKPSHGPQRSPLPESWMQPLQDPGSQAYGSPVSTFATSRRSSEGEHLSARRDPLYQCKPGNDGRFKCVFVENGKKCGVEPFKLKCNYDKHLDSHLKPYRCKQSGCAENLFSSTACLLRHEREAHGMHNHKEVLCQILDCERSIPGRGFPRKWNANDHMKRVHRFIPAEDSSSGGDASSPSNSSNGMPFVAGTGTVRHGGRRHIPGPEVESSSGPRNSRATRRRRSTTSRGGVAMTRSPPSSQQNFHGQGRSQNLAGASSSSAGRTFSEVFDPSLGWSQWPQQYHSMQLSSQDF